jgi:hypothetical protein
VQVTGGGGRKPDNGFAALSRCAHERLRLIRICGMMPPCSTRIAGG